MKQKMKAPNGTKMNYVKDDEEDITGKGEARDQ